MLIVFKYGGMNNGYVFKVYNVKMLDPSSDGDGMQTCSAAAGDPYFFFFKAQSVRTRSKWL